MFIIVGVYGQDIYKTIAEGAAIEFDLGELITGCMSYYAECQMGDLNVQSGGVRIKGLVGVSRVAGFIKNEEFMTVRS